MDINRYEYSGDNLEWICIEIYNSQEVQEESNQIKDILFI